MIILIAFLCQFSNAVVLEEPTFAYDREAQIQAGASAFAKTCYSCHSMKYLRTDDFSLKGGINPDNAPSWDPSSWNGHPPPDLSLITAIKGADYVYSYLRGYYVDEAHPSGFENIVMPGSQMPNPFAALQGRQSLVDPQHPDMRLFQALKLESRGSMSPQEFNEYVTSIVSYLDYASDPSVFTRWRIGPFVLLFLAIMILLMVALDLVYWHEIHERNRK